MQKSKGYKEKTINIGNLEVNYKTAGSGPAILILHGWGKGSDSWAEVQELLSIQGYLVITPDLPGFGKTSPPNTVWGVDEYTNFVLQFVQKLGLEKISLFGHSFGGQIAVKFAVSHPEKLEKLILAAPAAIRREQGSRENLIQQIARVGSILLFLVPTEGLRQLLRKLFARIIGRSDYLEAYGIMRKIMQRVIREDFSGVFVKISKSTLLVWGENDRPVPIEDAYVMQKNIPSSFLKIIPGVGHRIHREVPEQLVQIIVYFLK